jgi:hypothetical protein
VFSAISKVCDGDGLFSAVDVGEGCIVVAMVEPRRLTYEDGQQHLQRFHCLPDDSLIHQERFGKQWAWADTAWTDSNTRPPTVALSKPWSARKCSCAGPCGSFRVDRTEANQGGRGTHIRLWRSKR